MNKQQTRMMKGVAILLMVFLHLFNQQANVDLCHNLIYVGDIPLCFCLSRASNPVAFFLILGGYGLYRVYERGDGHRYNRLLKLLIHYWIILAIFVTIGHFINPSKYPGSILAVLSNVSGYQTTYNGEMWFLLPYILLSLLSPWLFRLFSRFKALPIIACTLFIHLCTSYCISRYGVGFLYKYYWIYDPLLVLHLLFNFSLGAMAARSRFFERLEGYIHNPIKIGISAWGGVIVLVSINCVFKYNFLYAFGIITCLLFARMPNIVKYTLCKLGDQSMNMWMIHSWFCYNLFHDFIYSFSYPVLIFTMLVVISYTCSLVINAFAKPIESRIMTYTENKTKPILWQKQN